MQKESPIREPLILGDKSYHDITVDVAKPVLAKANKLNPIIFWKKSANKTIPTDIITEKKKILK